MEIGRCHSDITERGRAKTPPVFGLSSHIVSAGILISFVRAHSQIVEFTISEHYVLQSEWMQPRCHDNVARIALSFEEHVLNLAAQVLGEIAVTSF